MKPTVVAIDGPAGSGKSTVSKQLASSLGFVHLNSGALYRGITLLALRSGAALGDEARLTEEARTAEMDFGLDGAFLLNGEDVSEHIRASEVDRAVSTVAALPRVRAAVTEQQRRIAAGKSVVIEGRDVTTVVFPNAQVKVYLDASVEERAARRHADLEAQGEQPSLDEVEREIRERDERDRTRADSPLLVAPDAEVIDTTGMSIDDVVSAIARSARSVVG
ncbi:(d)CMP kinase [Candidatus Poribacteria bacterium]|jgi:cytidylate kinase|nr:(d)CMP kinase [Candidatus Poribacteria bacterium]MBT5712520.1 (d)CMP kinase [Candidatus Poribacteria bacterium]MBT7097381.1 (d)CMP kinase [Candidatus Poribacteria bacterium]MBT7808346.1 (d)CMP kinase [Candidatus Poribacteria bacterium]